MPKVQNAGPQQQCELFTDPPRHSQTHTMPGKPTGREATGGFPCHYRSGINTLTDLRGYMEAGVPVGVLAKDITHTMKEEIIAYARAGGSVFIDSGAFPAFTKGKPVDWERVTKTYLSVVSQDIPTGSVTVVAPDAIGQQQETFRLQLKHATTFQALHRHGAAIIVPIQKGELASRQAWRISIENLRIEHATAGIPSNRKALTIEDIKDLGTAENPPCRFHLLGISPKNANYRAIYDTISRMLPHAHITSDSNRLRAQIGQGRRITAAIQDIRGDILTDTQLGDLDTHEMEAFLAVARNAFSCEARFELRKYAKGESQYDFPCDIPGIDGWYNDPWLYHAFCDAVEKSNRKLIRKIGITDTAHESCPITEARQPGGNHPSHRLDVHPNAQPA